MADHHETPAQTKQSVPTHGDNHRSPHQNRKPAEPSVLDHLLTVNEAIFWTVSRHLARLATAMHVPRSDIDDVIDEAWVSILEHRPLFQGVNLPRRLELWMRKVVHDKAVDLLRHLDSCPYQPLSDEGIEPIDQAAAKSTEMTELHEWLEVLMMEASQGNEVNLFLLRAHFFREVPVQELAPQVGMTIDAVNGRIRRLVERMHERAGKKFQR